MALICSPEQWLKTQVGCVSSLFLENFIWQILCREKSCPACQRVLASTLRCRKLEQREIAKLPRGCSPAKHAKESQAWLNILEQELPPRFWPTWQEKWQPVGKKSSQVLEQLQRKGRTSSCSEVLLNVYPGWWAGIKMEGCKHPLISCKAPIDVTVMSAQRSGPKYGPFVVQNMILLLFTVCCL